MTCENDSHEPSNMYAQTFARGLSVITSFTQDAGAMTISQVAAKAGMTRSTARRLLYTLTTLGYAATDGKNFTLTPKILDLGYAYLASSAIWRFAEPHVEALVEKVGESASISVLDGHDVIYVMRNQKQRLLTSPLSISSRLPAYSVSMGRVQLGALSDRDLNAYISSVELRPLTRWTITDPRVLKDCILRDRNQGWSLVSKELEEGIAGIAVPLMSKRGNTLASLNVSLHPERLADKDKQDFLIENLKETAAKIAECLPS